ncbi:hypothetical protein K501DRAFT_282611 [Backusella circina FSU 941]|nr:hypothetical protein K501DRAFT_282611 [Backusella circina FSU 941]
MSMSSFVRIGRVTPKAPLVRCMSQYIPGRKGYAPGFEAPEGTREEPKLANKRRDLLHSLPSHLGKSTNANYASPKKQFRHELKETRFRYAQELLDKEHAKRAASAEKAAVTEQKSAQLKHLHEQEKLEAKQHEEEVLELLSIKDAKVTGIEHRRQQRTENRLALEEAQRNTRRKHLLKLYSTTDQFVTLDNLDEKVDSVLSPGGRSFHDSLNELMQNSNLVQKEIEQRKAQIKEVMGL